MTPSDSAVQRKLLLAAFQMPAVATLVSRKSSITNAFVNTLIPQIVPSLEEIEHALVEMALRQSHGNQIKAARLLDISRDALRYKMKKFGLVHGEEEQPASPTRP